MKFSVTSLIDKERNIDYQYGGRKDLISDSIERDIKEVHKKLFDKYQEIKRLTTKIS